MSTHDILARLDELLEPNSVGLPNRATVEDAIDEIAKLRTRVELLESALENQRQHGAGATKGTAVG